MSLTTGICAHRDCDDPPLFEVWGPVGFEDYLTVCPPHIAEFLDEGDTLHLIGHEQSVEEMVLAALTPRQSPPRSTRPNPGIGGRDLWPWPFNLLNRRRKASR